MPISIKQAVEAHKVGKLEEAETLYRAILKDQPKHPDANHNLGVLAISVNKLAAALPLLRTAVEAKPEEGQYWISYIDALIKDNQNEPARLVLEQGKKMGLSGEKVDELSQRIISLSEDSEIDKNQSLIFTQQHNKFSEKKGKKNDASSPQRSSGYPGEPLPAEVNALLTHYKSGQYALAKKLAVAMTQKHANYQFGWKVLGAVFRASGQLPDAVVANQKAVALVPSDAEAHNNLGITLKELRKLDEAEASYKKAIALKPDYAEAHYNLGNTLQELGRLDESEATYTQSTVLKPNFAEAHNNLGITLKELRKLDEAEASFKKAISLKPDYAEAHYNMGATLKELARLNEAEASYSQAIDNDVNMGKAYLGLSDTLRQLGREEESNDIYIKGFKLTSVETFSKSNLEIVIPKFVKRFSNKMVFQVFLIIMCICI